MGLCYVLGSGEPEEEKVRQLKDLLASWVPPFAIKVLKFLMEFLVKVRLMLFRGQVSLAYAQ